MSSRRTAGRRRSRKRAADLNVAFFEEPSHSIGHLLRLGFRRFIRNLETETRPYGISAGQWGFLRVLWNEEGLTQRELSRRVHKREPTTVRALVSLESAGLVTRRASTVDRRRVHVHLTPKSRALKAKLLPFVAAMNERATRGFSADERAVLRELLRRVITNLADSAESDLDIDELSM